MMRGFVLFAIVCLASAGQPPSETTFLELGKPIGRELRLWTRATHGSEKIFLTQIRIGGSQKCQARTSTRANQPYPPRSAR